VIQMRLTSFWLVALALVLGTARPSIAQSSITQTDIQRLESTIYDVSRDIAQLRSTNGSLASRLQTELDDARDEATYLKVKLRKNETVNRTDYRELSDRVEDIRARARDNGRTSTPSTRDTDSRDPSTRDGGVSDTPSSSRRTAAPGEVPSGTEFDVRLSRTLSSETAQVEDRFEATTLVDLMQGDRVLVPAGSTMRGVVSSVTKATRTERKGSLTVAFDQITVRGRSYPIHAIVTQAIESEGIKGEAGKIGAGAGVGAIIGGILGGFKGAIAGILIGGGGTIAATEGKDVNLPAGSVLRVRLDTNLVPR
jgi:hypothetical protein